MKKTFIVILALLAAIAPATVPRARGQEKPGQVVVYYFHGDMRCASCLKIEQYTQGAIEEYFSEELGSGRLVLKVINVDTKENQHYAAHYRLYTKSVVISLVAGGRESRWKNLEKVWRLLSHKERFYSYIGDEVGLFLKDL